MKYFIFILLIPLQHSCPAQNGIYVPDSILRRELIKGGHMRGDSIYPQAGLKQLKLIKSGIRDLTGIRAFTGLWRLEVNANELSELAELPPNLTYLNCGSNKISEINIQHEKLKILICRNNQINEIKRLPESLEQLDLANNPLDHVTALPVGLKTLNISDCQFRGLPALPKGMSFLNYSGNPIDTSNLPAIFRRYPCRGDMNCLPAEITNWGLFKLENRDFTLQEYQLISKIDIMLEVSSSWGFGHSSIFVSYEKAGQSFRTTKAILNYSGKEFPKDQKGQGARVDSAYLTREFDHDTLFRILSGVFKPRLRFDAKDFGYQKSPFKIDLARISNSAHSIPYKGCHDCTSYRLKVMFLQDEQQHFIIELSFDDAFRLPRVEDTAVKNFPVKYMLEWIYLYQLSHLFFPEDKGLNTSVFHKKTIDPLAQWANHFFPELNQH